jgi:hypothetical protein
LCAVNDRYIQCRIQMPLLVVQAPNSILIRKKKLFGCTKYKKEWQVFERKYFFYLFRGAKTDQNSPLLRSHLYPPKNIFRHEDWRIKLNRKFFLIQIAVSFQLATSSRVILEPKSSRQCKTISLNGLDSCRKISIPFLVTEWHQEMCKCSRLQKEWRLAAL